MTAQCLAHSGLVLVDLADVPFRIAMEMNDVLLVLPMQRQINSTTFVPIRAIYYLGAIVIASHVHVDNA